jgi:hypothetical protein
MIEGLQFYSRLDEALTVFKQVASKYMLELRKRLRLLVARDWFT